ncbi:MAG: arginase family protein [Saprospirales bacterium]|nr:arginase family protein [Saprospirales bacterium]MBK8491175.1 arginase family protein [Saprospirales bacterium]
MLENWLRPLSDDLLSFRDQLPEESFGQKIRIWGKEGTDIPPGSLVLLGIQEPASELVRKALYALSPPPEGVTLIDLGNVRKEEPGFMIPLLKELFESNVCTLLVSSHPKYLQAQFQAQENLQRPVSMCVIDEQIAGPDQQGTRNNYLTELLKKPHPNLFHFSLLGLQSHLTASSMLRSLEKRYFEVLRLGALRADLTQTEPYLRDADLVGFQLSALRQAEAPGVSQATPSGLFAEEACQLARYAGMSDKLRAFGIYGFRPDLDRRRQTAQLCAHLVWYFADGFGNRKQDFPISTDGLLEYIVDFKEMDLHLTFWKSAKSGRWWLQVPEAPPHEEMKRHWLIPCSYADYTQASDGELPARLINALKRFK